MENESFEPSFGKRKRSSILKLPEKRVSRESRTVSFDDRCFYSDQHVSHLFLDEDMDLTNIHFVQPEYDLNNQTAGSMDMSLSSQQQQEDEVEEPEQEPEEPDAPDEPSLPTVVSMDLTLIDSYLPTASLDPTNGATNLSMDLDETLTNGNNVPNNNISEISSIMADDTTPRLSNIQNVTFGAYHNSNLSIDTNRTSGADTFMVNIEALDNCIKETDLEDERRRKKLDAEIEILFKWYEHIVSRQNKYNFALKVRGLRYSLWLILNVNPETYPNGKIDISFGVDKRDRHLYPFSEMVCAVRRTTQAGRPGYLTKFVTGIQKFRRFLRVYRLSSKKTTRE